MGVDFLKSRVVWECSPNLGDRSHPKLNKSGKPIVKKYSDGKVKRTLKRSLKVPEIVKREANELSVPLGSHDSNDDDQHVVIDEW